MEVLKIKEWKQKKDDLPQFEVILFDETKEAIWDTKEDNEFDYFFKGFKTLKTIKAVKRLRDGFTFKRGVFYGGKDFFQILKFHEDLICVDYFTEEFSGTVEINEIKMNKYNEFIGFV